ncbi:ABC transporter substrate-binding protein [Cellulomonas marina]|uniref:Multiple sugar transport system substrate-binding protein n=1 Tax=Cellulomonas marina TaxID=988821 RepID=A0A1I0WRT3_9CELL|nr:ABC transporter substrate-binding protein [Cellulomonas marina]GIG27843.1 sugar ABC transporter substrate-binding protein [Cellulomonas marina]SFA91475.1 multiple sugar transport system substrate-binding protein [Cellulomonas marina]
MSRTTVRAGVAAAGLVLALAACGGTSSADGSSPSAGGAGEGATSAGPVTLDLVWWGNDDRAARYEEAVALFEEQHPDITVNTSFAAFSDYWTARSTESAARALPDVMQIDSTYLRQYVATGQLLDLTDLLGDEIDTSGLQDTLLTEATLDGRTYAMPTATNMLAMFVNEDVLARTGVAAPPEGYTWEDLNAFIADVRASGATTDEGAALYGSADYTATFWFFLQWLVQQGVTPFTEDGGIGFDEDDVVEFLSLTDDLRADGALFPTERTVALAPLGGFTVNEVASEMSWDNFLAGYVADSGTENISMLPMPSGEDGPALFSRTFMMAAGANTEHPQEVAELLDFFLNEPEVGRIFGTSKGVPATAAQRDAMELAGVDAKVVAYEEQVADLVTEPAPLPVEGFGTLEAKWKSLGEELGYGSLTPEQFATKWFAEAELTLP